MSGGAIAVGPKMANTLVRKREWYRKHLIDHRTAAKLERARKVLQDHESAIRRAYADPRADGDPVVRVTNAIDFLCDGWEKAR